MSAGDASLNTKLTSADQSEASMECIDQSEAGLGDIATWQRSHSSNCPEPGDQWPGLNTQ